MKIYHEGLEWTTIPNTRSRPGSLFVRLVGVNISHSKGRTNVEPVYQAVISVSDTGNITLAWDKPIIQISFIKRWPFAIFLRVDEYKMEDM